MTAPRQRAALVPLVLALAACSSGGGTAPKADPSTASVSGAFDDTVRVVRGQATAVDGGRLAVTYTDLTDSRCPAKVQCVWAGDAAATLRLDAGGAVATPTLHTTLEPKAATHAGYAVTLVSVDPYPGTEPPNARLAATVLLRVARR
jgi:hypothetical protein